MFTSDEKPAIGRQINRFLLWLDRIPLWWTGILIVVVFFSPYFILGDGCIFEINDQLDESIMNYMLPARHLWDGSTVYPEMLGGVNASGMQPSAILFLPLYCLFSARVAFLTQYMICFVLAFLGMYLLVKESTEQYSGGDSRGMFLCAALISGLRSFRIRHSFGGICLSVPVETEKNPSRIDVYVTVRPDQPPGVYRLCGAGIVAFGTSCYLLSKKKE